MKIPSIQQTIPDLRDLFEVERQQLAQRKKNYRSRNPALADEMDQIMARHASDWEQKVAERLRALVQFPEHHGRHNALLPVFEEDGTFEESVFIMTKFPEGNTPKDRALRRVIAAVQTEVREYGYVPRVATRQYHPMLWDNVELHLVGCSRGIAIVEDRYRKELNPNVAMEWGWMRGMGRKTYYLMESRFKEQRADWDGFLKCTFEWENPEPGIRQAVHEWLGKRP